jgi:capsular polysaccharide biosynthesis protein
MKQNARDWKSRLKQIILFCLKSLPFYAEITGAPKGFYRSTLEWIEHNADQRLTYLELYPQHSIHCLPPKTLGVFDWRFAPGGNTVETPAAFVAVIPGGRVYSNNGVVISSDHRLLADLSIEFGVVPSNAADHSVFRRIKWSKITYTDKTLAVLSSVCSSNYFHWMYDVLPRVHLLEKSHLLPEIDQFIIGDRLLPFQIETLEAMGIPQNKLLLAQNQFHVKSARLIAPSLPGIPGCVPQWVCEFLRQKLLPVPESKAAHKIYISRSLATQRRILNEAQIVEYLVQQDFQIYTLEHLSVAEQARIFATADLIVAPHGAALSNLVFCRPQTKLIEIFSPHYLNPCYHTISNIVGIDYWYLLGQGTPPSLNTADHLRQSVGEDIEVDLQSLVQILKLL